eukprot:6825664-Ditylum_brightwellii.AAC.1
MTGSTIDGAGGKISLLVGDGRYHDGGDVIVSAGQTSASGRVGGRVALSGGEGSSSCSEDGGDGGNVKLFGSKAKGEILCNATQEDSFLVFEKNFHNAPPINSRKQE